METFLEGLSEWCALLWRASWQAAILAGLVLLCQGVFRSWLEARWRHALWWLVLIRLILPVSFPSPVSIYNLKSVGESPSPADSPPSAEPVHQAATSPLEIAGAKEGLEAEPTPPLGTAGLELWAKEGLPSREKVSLLSEFSSLHNNPERRVIPHPTSRVRPVLLVPSTENPLKVDFHAWASLLWLVGFLGMTGWMILSMVRFQIQVRRLPPLRDDAVLRLLEDCKRVLRIKAVLSVLEMRQIGSPAICGLLRPKLLLPAGFSSSLTSGQLRHVILHELDHLKRADVLGNWIMTVIQLLHWFNPLVWWIMSRMRRDRELACDALVLSCSGEDKKAYGQTIIHLAETLSRPALFHGSIGILEDKGGMRQRIRRIARLKPARKWSAGIAMVLLLVLGMLALTDAQLPETIGTLPPNPTGVGLMNTMEPGQNGGFDVSQYQPSGLKIILNVLGLSDKVLPAENVQIGEALTAALDHASIRDEVKFKVMAQPGGVYHLEVWTNRLTRFPLHQVDKIKGTISHPDYVSHELSWEGERGLLTNTQPVECTVYLQRGRQIGGRVTDAAGRPLENVRVFIQYYVGPFEQALTKTLKLREREFISQRAGFGNTPAAITDRMGRWTIQNVSQSGTFGRIEMQRPDGAYFYRDVLITSYPGEPIELKIDEGYSIRGAVVDQNSLPVTGVLVQEGVLVPRSGELSGTSEKLEKMSELKTDGNGLFQADHRPSGPIVFLLTKAGYAATALVVTNRPYLPECRVMMAPARPILIQVVDQQGNPIPNATASFQNYDTPYSLLDWRGHSDAQGMIVWSEPPLATVSISVYAASYGSRSLIIQPGSGEQKIVLPAISADRITVKGWIMDGTTDLPVQDFVVRIKTDPDKWRIAARGSNGSFRFSLLKEEHFPEFSPGFYRLRFESDGYQPIELNKMDYYRGDQELDLLMRKSDGQQGMVLLTNGKPADWATVLVPNKPRSIVLTGAKKPRYSVTDMEVDTFTQWNGRLDLPPIAEIKLPFMHHEPGTGVFSARWNRRLDLPPPADTRSLFIQHESGIGVFCADQLNADRPLILSPYGHLKGQLIGGSHLGRNKPAAGRRVLLHTSLDVPDPVFLLSLQTDTDEKGEFRFENIPPGQYQISQGLPSPGGGVIPNSIRLLYPTARIRAGENTQQFRGGGWVRIFGKIAIADPAEVDLKNDYTAMLKLADIPKPHRALYASEAEYETAHATWQQAMNEPWRTWRQYPVNFKKDGASFWIEDVVPGDYILTIAPKESPLTSANSKGRAGRNMGSLRQEVVVPLCDTLPQGVLELGVMEMKVRP